MGSHSVMLQTAYDSNADLLIDKDNVIPIAAFTGGINAYQVVIMTASGECIPADGSNPTHAGLVMGIALANILEGGYGLVKTSGLIENLAWDLDPGEIYFVSTAGTISKTPPITGFWQRIGIAQDSVTLLINLSEPVKVI